MTQISFIVEPSRLLLIWQSSGEDRNKYVVGFLIRAADKVALFYNYYNDDLSRAVKAGFQGHPAFPLTVPVHHYNVIEIFARRLPPRNRVDFVAFLQKHRLDLSRPISDFALLGYSGGGLPGDGFSCAIDFTAESLPHAFLMEVAGFRYHAGMHVEISELIGNSVMFLPEDANIHDTEAVRVFAGMTPIGYVPRYYAKLMRKWLLNHAVFAVVERIDGTLTNPKVHLFVHVASGITNNALIGAI